MNCPYCNKRIDAPTGFQEAWKFKQHLNRCKKHPIHIVVNNDGQRLVGSHFNISDAVTIRAKSGQ
jgi:hypothetical protein